MWIKAWTEHACLNTSEFLWHPCPTLTIPDLLYTVGTVFLVLYGCAPHLCEASQRLSSYRHSQWMATLLLSARKRLYAEMPTRENCQSVLQAIKADALTTCIPDFQHTRPVSARQACIRFTARPFLPYTSFHLLLIQHKLPHAYQNLCISPNQRGGRHISCKVSRL